MVLGIRSKPYEQWPGISPGYRGDSSREHTPPECGVPVETLEDSPGECAPQSLLVLAAAS